MPTRDLIDPFSPNLSFEELVCTRVICCGRPIALCTCGDKETDPMMHRAHYLHAMDATILVGERNGMEDKAAVIHSLSYEHICSMRTRMRAGEGYTPGQETEILGKMGRWLGWMQAAVVATCDCPQVNLETMKHINVGSGVADMNYQDLATYALIASDPERQS